MSLTCPNKSSKEWKALDTELGDTYAMMAYVDNNYDIPTVDEAYDILDLHTDVKSANVGDSEAKSPNANSYYDRTVFPTKVRSTNNLANSNELSKETGKEETPGSELMLDVMANFDTYFPTKRWMREDQRLAFAENAINNNIEISCGL